MERKVGEVFDCNGITLRVEMKNLNAENLCEGCFYNKARHSCVNEDLDYCSATFREDQTDVIFKLVE